LYFVEISKVKNANFYTEAGGAAGQNDWKADGVTRSSDYFRRLLSDPETDPPRSPFHFADGSSLSETIPMTSNNGYSIGCLNSSFLTKRGETARKVIDHIERAHPPNEITKTFPRALSIEPNPTNNSHDQRLLTIHTTADTVFYAGEVSGRMQWK
jgi:hypothetical protein